MIIAWPLSFLVSPGTVGAMSSRSVAYSLAALSFRAGDKDEDVCRCVWSLTAMAAAPMLHSLKRSGRRSAMQGGSDDEVIAKYCCADLTCAAAWLAEVHGDDHPSGLAKMAAGLMPG
ncbi:hypothetical protein LPH50_10075 [Xylella taiwanensis]|uniref:Uncharacterized protein n=2 Tax=Xylella taiwanensis TaxID=1444770 RepID=A0ABS8TU08_9GAMM|nr:hypothetical protein [Xylella taiwanensis]MCD8456278.1 hypothetical protein [Xylella taiwanensis]MCD8458686.1 hypothetical protein [Xylella taiwanensis]MCD8460822.1 hypothetical protein [Xylella taiwanensis]MCD8463121.1 hypothetical protein [Xylella taiwanensis]MCD8465328.1 hypothetical protein [Xylella taiwanensis]